MNVLIKSAKILDASSPHHNTTQDIYIADGVIQKVGKNLSFPDAKQISFKNLHVSQGWFDSSVSFGEPGYEERETIAHGLEVAARSGFTHIALNTNTDPKPDSRADIAFLLEQANGSPVRLYPKARITTSGSESKLAQLRELQSTGAVCFSNHKSALANANILKLALQYTHDFDGLVESFAFNQDMANGGVMHEGAVSTSLGLTGIPSVVEEMQIKRDLDILKYTNGKLHIPTLSTKDAIPLIKQAKKAGLDVSTSVSVHNLFFTDKALEGFNANAKLLPPLREQTDSKALQKALKDGTIDMVTSDHQPLNSELKYVELDLAHFGSIGLEHSFGCLLSMFDVAVVVDILTRGKARFGITASPIKEGATADISLFAPDGKETVTKAAIKSTSKNSLFMNQALSGKIFGVIAQNKVRLA
ncbi:MAG: dihydroorotase [Flavobacteriaceae bacterium]|nr:dihydroorotase [Flavobacteriaceae bacterium]